MPKQLDQFPVHGNQTYDWDLILNGQVWSLEKDVDFKARAHSVRSLALSQARRRGGRVKTHIAKDESTITVQFITDNESTEEVQD